MVKVFRSEKFSCISSLEDLSRTDDEIHSKGQRVGLGNGSGKSIAEVVSNLYSEGCNFGFVTKKGAKVLLNPQARPGRWTDDYSTNGVTEKKKKELNDNVYDTLCSYLEEYKSIGKTGFLEIIKDPDKIVNAGKKLLLGEKIEDLINEYISCDYGIIRRFLLKDRCATPKIIHRKKENLQEVMDKQYVKQPSLILKANLVDELRDRLAKEVGLEIQKLRYSPFALLIGERKDLEKLCEMGRSNSFGKFSNKLQGYLRNNASFHYNKGVYTPEVMARFSGNGNWFRTKRVAENMWNLENIGAFAAQETTQGANVKVGIIDTGVDYNHHELSSLFGKDKGWDFIKDDAEPMDYNMHGTHVAGTTGGQNVGIATGCNLYSLRALDENGSGRLSTIIEAVSYAVGHKLDVINLSLGSPSPSQLEYETFQAAKNAGLLICAAAGNESYGPSYPASYDCVMSVAAVDINNQHADFSNIWETNCISAPGVGVYSCVPNNGYDTLSGTSMATPHLAGVAALARSIRPGIFQDDFISLLSRTAEGLGNPNDLDNSSIYGAGLVRADRLVAEVTNARIHNRIQGRYRTEFAGARV